MLYLIESKFIITMGFVGLANSAVSPLFPMIPYHPFTQPHLGSCTCVYVCVCVCAFLQYPELQLAPECIVPARSVAHCTSQCHYCRATAIKFSTLSLLAIKANTEVLQNYNQKSHLKIILRGDTEFSIVLPPLNITLYQAFLKILRS